MHALLGGFALAPLANQCEHFSTELTMGSAGTIITSGLVVDIIIVLRSNRFAKIAIGAAQYSA